MDVRICASPFVRICPRRFVRSTVKFYVGPYVSTILVWMPGKTTTVSMFAECINVNQYVRMHFRVGIRQSQNVQFHRWKDSCNALQPSWIHSTFDKLRWMWRNMLKPRGRYRCAGQWWRWQGRERPGHPNHKAAKSSNHRIGGLNILKYILKYIEYILVILNSKWLWDDLHARVFFGASFYAFFHFILPFISIHNHPGVFGKDAVANENHGGRRGLCSTAWLGAVFDDWTTTPNSLQKE